MRADNTEATVHMTIAKLPWTPPLATLRPDRAAGDDTALPPDRLDLVRAAAEAHSALADAVIAAAEAAVRARSVAAMLDETLAVLTDARPASDRMHPQAVASRHETDSLSPREREVLAMVAEGRTNKAIAAALYVSPNTIKTHVSSLLAKLHAETRAQLAAIAATYSVHPDSVCRRGPDEPTRHGGRGPPPAGARGAARAQHVDQRRSCSQRMK
jgi:DNA-binding CsgD family transcriptional regulator